MQTFVIETAPHIWSVFDDPHAARQPMAQFTDKLDAKLWAAARAAAEKMRSCDEKIHLINMLADAAQRGHNETRQFRAA